MSLPRLLAFGSNSCGQLGIGHKKDVSDPEACLFESEGLRSLPKNDRIVKVVAGGSHTLLRFGSGAVFAAGNNVHGQCGLGEAVSETHIFRRVVLSGDSAELDLDKFDDIAATWQASYLVKADGRIWVFGSGAKGELGLGEAVTHARLRDSAIDLSLKLGRPTRIVEIAASVGHVVVLTHIGELIGWGTSRKGQLGDDAKAQKVLWEPTSMGLPLRSRKLALGRDFTFIVDDEGDQSLLGSLTNMSSNANVGDVKVISASWSGIYGLSDGRTKAIGRNDRGQLPPDNLPALKMLSSGSEHCVGLTDSAKVISWGWGEHGNCGKPLDENGNVSGRWNIIPSRLRGDEFVSGVAAGCATSFMIVDNKV